MAFEGRGEVSRRRWSLAVGSAVLFAVSVALMALGAPRWGAFVEHALALTLVLAFLGRGYRVRRAGQLRADAGGLSLDGERVVARAEIACAYLVPTGRPVVRIVRGRRGDVEVELEGDAEAEALVQALGFGVGQAVATFGAWAPWRKRPGSRLRRAVAAVATATLLAWWSIVYEHHVDAAWLALYVCALAAVQLVTFARVHVGSDGLLVRRLFGARFVSYADVVDATVEDGTLVVRLARGTPLLLARGRAAIEALARRVEDAREAYLRASGATAVETHVAPEGRSVDRWLGDLRRPSSPHAYRVGGGDADVLWRVLDDASQPPATRAGAAVSLASSADDAARARIRVAAESCAEPRLRVALTRVAENAEDAALEEALAPLLERDA